MTGDKSKIKMRHAFTRNHRRHWQHPILMRKQRPAARDFPFQGVAELAQVDGRNDETGLPREMLGERFVELVGCRHVDIAIGQIDRRTGEDAFGLELRPLVGGQDFVGDGHGLQNKRTPKRGNKLFLKRFRFVCVPQNRRGVVCVEMRLELLEL